MKGNGLMGMILNEENINKVLTEQVNPALNLHSGGVILRSLDDGVAVIKFTGACAGCYSADQTMEHVVKKTLVREFPDLKSVELDDSVDEDLLAFARKLMRHEI